MMRGGTNKISIIVIVMCTTSIGYNRQISAKKSRTWRVPFLLQSDTHPFCIQKKTQKAKRKLDMASESNVKPHAVLTPAPLQAHLISMLKLAKVLHHRGFHITYVTTEFIHKRLMKSRGPKVLDGLPDFRFETIPDGLPATDDRGLHSVAVAIRENCPVPFQKLFARLNDESSSSNANSGVVIPPVSCLVSDTHMTFTIKGAQELGLPILLYCTAGTASYLSVAHARNLFDKGIIPLKDESYLTNGYLDTQIDCIPGMKNIRLKDLPSIFWTTYPNDLMLNFGIADVEKAHGASAIAFNTFDELEGDVMNALSSFFSLPLYTIGPIPLLVNQIPQNDLASIHGINFWNQDTLCLEWLESKEPRSIIYVNFGSSTVMSKEQLYEFAWGLANSKKPFLWIIRPDLVNGGSTILSSEFVNETKDRSLIASWCPQEQVLNHPSIGGFLTHCGWNSITESICAGVPMICWPFFGDQPTNCRYACTEWEIGMEIDPDVKRDEVEQLVNELMVGEKGKKIKQKAMEWKRKAEEDAKPGGSSYMNMEKIIKEVLLMQN